MSVEARHQTQPEEPWVAPTWDDVVRDHSARVYRLAYRLTGNRHDAEDLTQEVFVRVFRSLSQLHPRHVRGLAAPDHDQPVPRHGPSQGSGSGSTPSRTTPSASPAGSAPRSRSTTTSTSTVTSRRLSTPCRPDFRAAVVLCDLEGLPYDEIAATLGIKVGTVRSRIHRGRSQLRAALAHRDPAARPAAGAGVPGMTAHLGPAATAFVDGQLDHRRRDEVLAHLLHCAQCRADVRAGPGAQGVPAIRRAAPSRSTSASGCWPRRRPRIPASIPRAAPREGTGASAVPRWGVPWWSSASAATLSLAGPPPAGPPAKVDPSSVRFVIDHATTAGEVPFSEPEIVPVSSARPAAVSRAAPTSARARRCGRADGRDSPCARSPGRSRRSTTTPPRPPPCTCCSRRRGAR